MTKKLFGFYFSLFFLAFPIISLAAQLLRYCPIDDAGAWIKCIIENLVNIVVWPIFVFFVVVMFIVAGFKFLTAQGEPGKIDAAKKTALWAVIGVAVGIIAFSAVTTIKWFLGLP